MDWRAAFKGFVRLENKLFPLFFITLKTQGIPSVINHFGKPYKKIYGGNIMARNTYLPRCATTTNLPVGSLSKSFCIKPLSNLRCADSITSFDRAYSSALCLTNLAVVVICAS